MKIPTYNTTPGLERYPEGERFSVYRATHSRLMRDNLAYRQRWISGIAGIITASTIPTFLESRWASFTLLLVPIQVACILYLSFRQQKFMNRKVGEALSQGGVS